MKEFNVNEFMRDLYLASEPSIDLKEVKGPINPGEHRILMSKLNEIEAEYGIEPGTDLYGSICFLIIDKGPQLVE